MPPGWAGAWPAPLCKSLCPGLPWWHSPLSTILCSIMAGGQHGTTGSSYLGRGTGTSHRDQAQGTGARGGPFRDPCVWLPPTPASGHWVASWVAGTITPSS